MIRQVIQIDEDKCTGCGICADACHEGAIEIVDGKAKLMRDDYCDGLGDCLPTCPTGAISFVQREAAAYDEEAVKKHMEQRKQGHGCPGAQMHTMCPGSRMQSIEPASVASVHVDVTSQLRNWPVQIQLVPVHAPYFQGAKLLIAADCTAYAYANFHEEFVKGKITLIGCPKLDPVDYSEKLTEIIRLNDIKSVTIVRMEVPCCGGLEHAAMVALQNSGKMIPWQVKTISIEGEILDD